jgi:predicted metalloendopeptidase
MRSIPLTAFLAATLLTACAKQAEQPKPAPAAPAKPVFGTFGVDLASMDKTVKPGDDFYKFVNGKWLETAQIPPDKSYYGTVVTVFENTEANLHKIVDELASTPHEPGSVDQKVADFYASWMDQDGIENADSSR